MLGVSLALDEHLEVDRGRGSAGGREVGVEPEQVVGDLPLVVDGTAGEEFLAADRGLERRPLPQLLRVDRLHVVVAVEHDGRGAVVPAGPLGEHRRQAGRLPDLHRREAGPAQRAGEPLGAAAHIRMVLGLGGYRRDAQPLVEVGVQPVAVFGDVRALSGHGPNLSRPVRV
jgi:hypothetical protein